MDSKLEDMLTKIEENGRKIHEEMVIINRVIERINTQEKKDKRNRTALCAYCSILRVRDVSPVYAKDLVDDAFKFADAFLEEANKDA